MALTTATVGGGFWLGKAEPCLSLFLGISLSLSAALFSLPLDFPFSISFSHSALNGEFGDYVSRWTHVKGRGFCVNPCGFGVVWESRPWRSWVCGVRAKRLTGLVGFSRGLCRGWWMWWWLHAFGRVCGCGLCVNPFWQCECLICQVWGKLSATFPKWVVCVIVGLFQLFAETGVWLYQCECKCVCVCVRVVAQLWRCEIGIIVNLSV